MDKVIHKIFGVGEVVKREVKENRTYITVQFEDERQSRFAIPDSFLMGIIEAEGGLKDEVDRAIEEKTARENAKRELNEKIRAVSSSVGMSRRYGVKTPKKIIPRGPIAEAYQEYLAKAGYSLETDDGSPSTVYAYAKAVQSVIFEESTTWDQLKNDIATIVKKYDVGGAMEEFGCKSNKTVINALRRFEEFVKTL